MCGNYGDPSACADAIRIVQYFQEKGRIPSATTTSSSSSSSSSFCKIKFHTNGGARNAKFWTSLGALLSRARGKSACVFAFDGLEDTNHLYRQGVKWKAAMRNARAFMRAGGEAHWKFIVFEHNEHQIEAARKMAKTMGFARFQPVKTKRFFKSSTGAIKTKTPVRDLSGEIVRHLRPPRDPKWQNRAAVAEARELLARYEGKIDTYYDKACVRCKAIESKEIFVSAEGHVYPCTCDVCFRCRYSRLTYKYLPNCPHVHICHATAHALSRSNPKLAARRATCIYCTQVAGLRRTYESSEGGTGSSLVSWRATRRAGFFRSTRPEKVSRPSWTEDSIKKRFR